MPHVIKETWSNGSMCVLTVVELFLVVHHWHAIQSLNAEKPELRHFLCGLQQLLVVDRSLVNAKRLEVREFL